MKAIGACSGRTDQHGGDCISPRSGWDLRAVAARIAIIPGVADDRELNEDQKRERNTLIAIAGGSFIFPIAGVAGALMFFMRHEERNAKIVLAAVFAGAVVYGALFALAG